MRVLRLIENLTLGAGAVGYLYGVDARRRLAPGAAHHDRAAVEPRPQEGAAKAIAEVGRPWDKARVKKPAAVEQ